MTQLGQSRTSYHGPILESCRPLMLTTPQNSRPDPHRKPHLNTQKEAARAHSYALNRLFMLAWSGRQDSNLRPPEPHSGALPNCATPRQLLQHKYTTSLPYLSSTINAKTGVNGVVSEPVSRVLSWMIIYLGYALLRSSCGDTREVSGQLQPSPIRPCSRWGLPSLRLTTELVVSYTTVSAFLRLRIGFSFLWHFPYPVNRTVAASNHLALRSPDFPPRFLGAITQLAHLHATI